MLGGVLLLALHGFLFADGAEHVGLTALAPMAAQPHATPPPSGLGGELLRESLPSMTRVAAVWRRSSAC